MKVKAGWLLVLTLIWVACIPGTSDSPEDNGNNGAGGEGDSTPFCREPCSSPADCGIAGSGPYRPENYVCTDGLCQYQGCASDEECAEASSETILCRDVNDEGTAFCVASCQTAADCPGPSSGRTEENYACNDGACQYTGCLSHPECEARHAANDGQWGCFAHEGLKDCRKRCNAPQDCEDATSPDVRDADNFECTAEGFCLWTGCNSDDECNPGGVTDLVCAAP
jgi:hypothetical protein